MFYEGKQKTTIDALKQYNFVSPRPDQKSTRNLITLLRSKEGKGRKEEKETE